MGVSGAGNFDDDDAHDYLMILMDKLNKEIEACLIRCDKGQFNLEEGNFSLLPPMDILIALSNHYGHFVNQDQARVRKWKQTYLQLYDETIDDYGPVEGHKEARRKVIEATFDRFEEKCIEDNDIEAPE